MSVSTTSQMLLLHKTLNSKPSGKKLERLVMLTRKLMQGGQRCKLVPLSYGLLQPFMQLLILGNICMEAISLTDQPSKGVFENNYREE